MHGRSAEIGGLYAAPELGESKLDAKSTSECWQKMSGADSYPNLEPVWGNNDAVLETCWKQIEPRLDEYIQKYQIPTQQREGEDDKRFLVRVITSMESINSRAESEKKG